MTLEEFYHPPKQKSNPEFKEMIEESMNNPMFGVLKSLLLGKSSEDEEEDEDDGFLSFWDDEKEENNPLRLASNHNETFVREVKR
ncbi:MAG: hypothetical protein HC803_08200 [Saprospiraceae bacterium]|nr:hypothetical protein [Saprospiraceae bacterium]